MLLKRQTPSCVLMCALFVACFARAIKTNGQLNITLTMLEGITVKYLQKHETNFQIHQEMGGVYVSIQSDMWHELSAHATMTYHPKDSECSLKPTRKHLWYKGTARMDDVIHALEAVQAQGIITGQYKLSFKFSKRNLRQLIAHIDGKLITRH